ncbi:MAG: Bax inhibitor-1/YccA family protein [Solidesulfovibrio sp.]|uniref:Bax inhibitor-1/YccA family protein n=1 Tax=Solidesulfovibrio sp. TaxID=2910990 RepID=UPI002B1F5363|nr:Bax inhibitor-1/YccA family protein [Solidesulfovibrio sp.]MEA4856358.1 Bax inhibitor-1/YccA family protein [Solidesulfovibrio sp.]
MSYPYRSMQTTQSRVEVVNAFMRGVYGWMCLGLLLTAGASAFTVSSPALMQAVFGNQILFFGLIIVEFGLVLGISAAINRLSAGAATGLFLLYSALNGVTLAAIFAVYAKAVIINAFLVTGGMFGAMSLYGLLTRRDLTSLGSFLFMGLIGVIIASIVNIFTKSAMMDFIISCVGVLVFLGLTAYDTQKLKVMGEMAPADDATAVRRGTILGALTLYLDFINLFLMMLRLFGGSSRD